MKKIVLFAASLSLAACHTPAPQSNVPLDMQTVQEYQQRIATPRSNPQAEHWDLTPKAPAPKVVIVKPHHPPRFSAHYGTFGMYHRHELSF